MEIDILVIARDLINDIDEDAQRQATLAEGMKRGVEQYYVRIQKAIAEANSGGQSGGETPTGEQPANPSDQAGGAASS